MTSLAVREITAEDVAGVVSYWLSRDAAALMAMGVDPAKMLSKEQWQQLFAEQLAATYRQKKSYCLIWLCDGIAVGHSNINKIVFGEEAFVHLHLWDGARRQRGMGVELLRLSLPHYFEKFDLKRLCCEPYAQNEAPNKTLARGGFSFVREYVTTPGFLNFEQPVKRWELLRPAQM